MARSSIETTAESVSRLESFRQRGRPLARSKLSPGNFDPPVDPEPSRAFMSDDEWRKVMPPEDPASAEGRAFAQRVWHEWHARVCHDPEHCPHLRR